MEVEAPDREAGIALITGQIVEAWLGRQPITKGTVTADQLGEVIMAVRVNLATPLPNVTGEMLEGILREQPGLRLVDKP
jgi:hypothetical protein